MHKQLRMMMCIRACGNIGTTFEALKQHSTATTYHEQVRDHILRKLGWENILCLYFGRAQYFKKQKVMDFFWFFLLQLLSVATLINDRPAKISGYSSLGEYSDFIFLYSLYFGLDYSCTKKVRTKKGEVVFCLVCFAQEREIEGVAIFWPNYHTWASSGPPHPSPSAPSLVIFLFSLLRWHCITCRSDRVPTWSAICCGWTSPGETVIFCNIILI